MDAVHDPPYWLTEGTERCRHCEQGYLLEMECRCVECDVGLCIHCVLVLRATQRTHCASCAPDGAEP
jgi:hypothetical protein